MSSVLMTSTMKSEFGVPITGASADGAVVSAAATFADGGSADGFAGVDCAGAAAIALLSRSLTALAAPATATVPRNFRRLTAKRGDLSDIGISPNLRTTGVAPCVSCSFLFLEGYRTSVVFIKRDYSMPAMSASSQDTDLAGMDAVTSSA
jgi:hypothetical protein